MSKFSLEHWKLAVGDVEVGLIGSKHDFNGGYSYNHFEPTEAFAEFRPVVDAVNQAPQAWWDYDGDDEAEDDRLQALATEADGPRRGLPLRLISPDGGVVLAAADVHVHMEDSPPCVRVKLLRPSWDLLREVGLLE